MLDAPKVLGLTLVCSSLLIAATSTPATLSSQGRLAHLWVTTNGGTCTRSEAPAPYDPATACVSLAAAYAAANANSDESLVLIRSGTYSSGLTLTGTRTSTSRITFEPEGSFGTVRFSGSALVLGTGRPGTAPRYLTLRGLVGAEFGSGTCPDCRYGLSILTGSAHITVEDSHVGMVLIHGSSDILVRNNELGPCRARTISTDSTKTTEAGCSYNKVDWFGAQPTRITYEYNLMRDYDLTSSCFTVAQGGTNTAGWPDCHWRPFWCIGCKDLVFRGNTIRDSKEGPALPVVGDARTAGMSNILIENNFFGAGVTYGAGQGNFRQRDYGRSGGFEMGASNWCAVNPGVLCVDGFTYRFNSHYRNSGLDIYDTPAGLMSNMVVYGNIGARTPCRSWVTYRYNLWANSGTCHGTDVNINAAGTIPFYMEDLPAPSVHSYKLTAASALPDLFVPVSLGCPAIDKFGTPRPATGFCTAGAHQSQQVQHPDAPTGLRIVR
jgi:hypothetical protein